MQNDPFGPDPATSALGVSAIRMTNLSDEDVMEQIRQGHPDALLTLFDRFYRLVLKVALRILRDPGEAEDLMQDVFLEIFNKASQFDPGQRKHEDMDSSVRLPSKSQPTAISALPSLLLLSTSCTFAE